MSISIRLICAGEMKDVALRELISRYASDVRCEADGAIRFKLVGCAVYLSAARQLTKDVAKDSLSINVNISITCRIDKFESFDVGRSNALRFCTDALKSLGSDGVLLFGDDTPVLLRRNGACLLRRSPNHPNDEDELVRIAKQVCTEYEFVEHLEW